MERREFDVACTWTFDEFVGYLYWASYSSTAFCGMSERSLRARLLEFDLSGRYEETISACFVLGPTPALPRSS